MAIKRREYCKNNATKLADYFRSYRKENIESRTAYEQAYYSTNRERIIARCSDYVARNAEKTSKYQRHWREKNADKKKEYDRQYVEKNREKIRKWHAEYERKHRKGYLQRRPLQRLAHVLRVRVCRLLKQHVKSARTSKLIGCTAAELQMHMEAQFKPGMNWNNYGHGHDKWNADHIIPCAAFDLSKAAEQQKCFHYLNLQPMWQIENFKKGKRH